MNKEYDYIIVGGGLCGLSLARELTRKDKSVLILEKGGFIDKLGSLIRTFTFYDRKLALIGSRQGVKIYRCFGVGGTSLVSCGNAVEPSTEDCAKLGIDIKEELTEAKKDSCVRQNGLTIGKASMRIMQEANKLGYDMLPMPKFSSSGKCASCGDCVIGCAYYSKWTGRDCLEDMQDQNYSLITGFSVNKVISQNGRAVGVEGIKGMKKQSFFAGKIILAAGGIGTPIILQKSGIEAGKNLFVDLFNVTYGVSKEFNQQKELTMSVVCAKFHASEGFVISPFVDNLVSFSSGVSPRYLCNAFRLNKLMGVMTKIADDNTGRVYQNGRVDKAPSEADLKKLKRGSDISKEILIKCGVNPKSIFVTNPVGAHPGGSAAIGKVVNNQLETQMKGLYACDASVLASAPGLPPILTLIALTKWFAKNILTK
ncbi:MAG: GMC family oxidoreductase N-terminal domain-containing protein [Candidatus Omnitrophica bacterium]|nr:GMC family oxidoreductase N-terminal domain-containing protein [Candidatus Omnitrophota bacterium]